MTIKCLVVDDEPLARDGIKDYIAEVEFLECVGEFGRAAEAAVYLKKNKVDLIFLDINMPKMTGLELVKALKSPPLTIFTTAYREFAVDSYELNGFDYLVKPITFTRFLQACDKLYDHFDRPQADVSTSGFFFIKEDGKLIKIFFDKIHCIEGYKDYVKIHLDNRSHLALMSLKSINDRLPPAQFLRVHKSFIVARNKVDSVAGNLLMIGERKIPVGKSLRETVFAEIVGDNVWKRK